jgi:hypothetical protein
MRLFAAVRGVGLSFPVTLMRLYRALIIADMVMLRLNPRINWVAVLRAFVRHETAARASRVPCAGPLTQAGMAALLRVTKALDSLTMWVDERLPTIGRRYERRVTAAERLFLNAAYIVRLALPFFLIWLASRRL